MSAYSVLIPVSCVLCPPFYKCCHLRMFLSPDWVAGRAAGVVGCLVMPEYSLPAVTMVLELVKTGEVAIPTSLHYECQYLITELGLKNIVEEVVGVTEEMVKVVEVTEEMVEVVEEVEDCWGWWRRKWRRRRRWRRWRRRWRRRRRRWRRWRQRGKTFSLSNFFCHFK